MKKWIVIFALTLFAVTTNAQFGLQGGANFATITGDDTEDAKMRVAFYMGVFYNIIINETFSVRSDLAYSSQGSGIEDSDNTRLILNYMNLSPLLRYYSQSGFFALTGPQFGFLLSAKIKDDNTSVDWKEFVKSFDFAWAFALGYQFQNGLGVQGRYNLGLANIADGGGNVKNMVFQIGLLYLLNSTRK